MRWSMWAWAALYLAGAAAFFVSGQIGWGFAFVGLSILFAVLNTIIIERLPYAIATDTDGVRFLSRRGDVVIGWTDLVSVVPLRSRVPRLRWKWNGGEVTTWNGYDHQTDLLHELMRRAPKLISLP
jgi:hypothetical protein